MTSLFWWHDSCREEEPQSANAPDVVTLGLEARPVGGLGSAAAGAELLRLAPDARGAGGQMAGTDRASAREISNAVAQQTGNTVNEKLASDFLWIWGQFLDHDLSLTEAGHTSPAGIQVPIGDPYFDPEGFGLTALPFMRVDPTETGGYANEITAFIDASMIYGSDQETFDEMREDNGKLKMTEKSQLVLEGADVQTGDTRAAENVALTSMHTIFTREHNRIVDELAAQFPELTSDELFEAARARVEAIVQAITYNEFLPMLVGDRIPEYQGYDESVNPGIAVEFSTAVFRLGHTLLSANLQMVTETGESLDALSLRDAFFRPSLIAEDGMIENLLRGAATQTAQAVDTMVVEDIRSFLFGAPGMGGLDLASINIQRGRDLGVASYNDLREAVGFGRAEDWSDITADTDLQTRLASVYDNVDQVDAWVGGLAEDNVVDSLFGQTFTFILVDQFTRLRDGDPYWTEERGFSDAELSELWSTRLSDVILRNTDIEAIQRDVFLAMNRVMGTAADDQLTGGEDADFIWGGAGRDRLHGNAGNDDLQGGDGNDILVGGHGDDVLTGGAGRDAFRFSARHDGTDTITDFDLSEDRIALDFHTHWWRISLENDGDDAVLKLDKDSTVVFEGLGGEIAFWWQLL